jgi:hypothetical protein
LTPSSFDVSSVDDDVSDNVLAVTTTATATAVTAEAGNGEDDNGGGNSKKWRAQTTINSKRQRKK